MSESFTGTVQAVRGDRKGVKINNEWYSVRNASVYGTVAKGDTVSGTFTRNGRWINCDEASIQITKGAPAASGGGGGGGGNGGGHKSGFREVDEIIRTTSLEAAVAFFSELSMSGDYATDIEYVLKTADLFVAYTKGLIDVGAMETPAPLPAAPAQQEPAPVAAPPAPEPAPQEATPAVQPSALSAFLGNQ